jgi:hypothetical protein
LQSKDPIRFLRENVECHHHAFLRSVITQTLYVICLRLMIFFHLSFSKQPTVLRQTFYFCLKMSFTGHFRSVLKNVR